MRILLLSAYHTASHRYWCDGLMQQFSECEWECLTLPPRYFSWRIRGNALSWALSEQEKLTAHYDLLIATSMVDLSTLRGLIPQLANVPSIVYFHENQFAYPKSSQQHSSIEPQVVTLYSALCADRVVFNSEFNRQSFLLGVDKLLRKLPDCVPPNVVSLLEQKSGVLPVPLVYHGANQKGNKSSGSNSKVNSSDLNIVWNHRWEYDKGPDHLHGLLKRIPMDWPIKCHIVGQQFRSSPKAFDEIQRMLVARDALGYWGFVEDKATYHHLLQSCDIVLSTADHDFQGLAVLEGVMAGCFPVVPDHIVFSEWFPSNCLYALDDPEAALGIIARVHEQKLAGKKVLVPSTERFTWSCMRGAYAELFSTVANRKAINLEKFEEGEW